MANVQSGDYSKRSERAERERMPPDAVERLRRLKALYRHGALTDAELLAAQKKLLGGG